MKGIFGADFIEFKQSLIESNDLVFGITQTCNWQDFGRYFLLPPGKRQLMVWFFIWEHS